MVIMTNDSDLKKKGQKGGAAAQPMNPTTGAEEFFGDATGITGVTPHNKASNEDTGRRLSPELTSDEEYDKNTLNGMSQVARDEAEDIATEKDLDVPAGDVKIHASDADDVPYTVNKQNTSGDDSPRSDAINTEQAPYTQPSNQGEESISGSEADPTADDDTQEVVHAVGTQMEEDDSMEHPKELNLGEDTDRAERDIKNS